MSNYNDDRSDGPGFFAGVIVGTALGAAAAMLFAVKPGTELREDLASSAQSLGDAAKEKWDGVASTAASVVDAGRDAVEQVRGAAQQVADTASRSVDRFNDGMKQASAGQEAHMASSGAGQKPS